VHRCSPNCRRLSRRLRTTQASRPQRHPHPCPILRLPTDAKAGVDSNEHPPQTLARMEGFTSRNTPAGTPIYRITGSKQLTSWLTGADNRDQAKFVQQWATASNFTGRPNQVLLVPGKAGELSAVLVGVDEQEPLWQLAKLPAALPKGKYRVADCADPALAERLCLGWGLGTYSFDRYKK